MWVLGDMVVPDHGPFRQHLAQVQREVCCPIPINID